MSDQVGRVLGGRYRLLAQIGAGGSAQVYLAEDVQLHRRVAVKVLRDVLAAEPGFLHRFEAEARAAAALNHPNIVAIHDVGEDDVGEDRVPYLVTEYLAGGSLQALLAGGRLSVSQALLVGLDAARGLEYAHRQGLVHRDIKPANLLFGEEGRLRIADFELARALAEVALTEPDGTPLGTARYASPEQVRGDKVGPAGDVYSLALVLVEAVTGVAPFAADTTVGSLMARLDRPLEVPDSLGPLQQVLSRAGAIDPRDRPGAGELVGSLLAAAEELPRPDTITLPGAGPVPATELTDVAPSPVGEQAPRQVPMYDHALEEVPAEPRRGWAIAVVVTVLLGLVGAGLWVWWQGRTPTHGVPQLVGRPEEELDELVAGSGWDVEVTRTREEGSAPGEIVDQDPEAGTRLAEGEALLVTVSLGNPLAPFPTDLVGTPLPEVEQELAAAGFEVGEVTRTYDEEVERDVVMALGEEFREIEELPTSTPVDLVVSDGPAPRRVPDLTGRTFAEAREALEGLGLAVRREDRASREDAEGVVLEIDPVAGSEVQRGGEVTVVVSSGPPFIEMPDVAGMTPAEATEALEDARLAVAGVDGPPNRPVVTTDPAPGERVQEGTEVRLVTTSLSG